MRRFFMMLVAWTACLGCQNDTPGFDPFMRRHYVPPPGTGSYHPPGIGPAPYYPGPVVTPGATMSPPAMTAPPVMALPPSSFSPPPPMTSPPPAFPSSQPNYQNIQPPPFGVPALNSRANHSPWPRPEMIAAERPLPGPVTLPSQATGGIAAAQPASYVETAPLAAARADNSGWRPAGAASAAETKPSVEHSVLVR